MASYLETGPASQGASELHHHTADFVTHGSMPLMMVNGRGTSGTGCARGPSGSGGGSARGSAPSVCLAPAHQTGLERGAGGSAGGAGSAGSVAACERHGC